VSSNATRLCTLVRELQFSSVNVLWTSLKALLTTWRHDTEYAVCYGFVALCLPVTSRSSPTSVEMGEWIELVVSIQATVSLSYGLSLWSSTSGYSTTRVSRNIKVLPTGTLSQLWTLQEAQLSPKDRAMRRVSWNLANCHATVQKLLVRQVLNKSKLWSWRVTVGRCVINIRAYSKRVPHTNCALRIKKCAPRISSGIYFLSTS